MHFHPFYAPEDNDQEAPRSFSPEEVEALIAQRISSERAAREQAENALMEKQQQIFAHEMREAARSALEERGLPAQLIDVLNLSSKETLHTTLQCAESAFREALEEGVRTRLRGLPPSAPPAEQSQKTKPLSYRQAAALYQSDRAAYDKRYGGM